MYTYLIFFFSIISGLTASSFFSLWLILELNILAFLFIIYLDKYSVYSRSVIKYFIIQAISSAFIIWRVFLEMLGISINTLTFFFFSFIIAKIGLTPFHRWLLSLSQKIRWSSLFFLLTFQKLIPLYFVLVSLRFRFLSFIVFLCCFSSFIILNENLIKRLIRVSSLVNLGWLILALPSVKLFMLFYLVYSFTLLILFKIFFGGSIILISELKGKLRVLEVFILLSMFLSLSGLPPFIGFWLKTILLLKIILVGQIFLGLTLLVSGVLAMKAYIGIVECFLTRSRHIVFFSTFKKEGYIRLSLLLLFLSLLRIF